MDPGLVVFLWFLGVVCVFVGLCICCTRPRKSHVVVVTHWADGQAVRLIPADQV